MFTDLAVCKDRSVVSFKAALDESLCAVGVDSVLLTVHVKDMVVGEGLVFTQHYLWLTWHHICTNVTPLDLLFGQLRTNPGRHKDAKSEVFN